VVTRRRAGRAAGSIVLVRPARAGHPHDDVLEELAVAARRGLDG